MIAIMSIEENDAFEFSINFCSNSSVATPGSPSSPADHFFLNGKLLPHSFPSGEKNSNNNNLYYYRAIYSRSTSRTSSVSSKDSFYSSRSNSTSTYSSSRTSTSENPEQVSKLTNQQQGINKLTGKSTGDDKWQRYTENPLVSLNYRCRSLTSQRWQFITAVPVGFFCSRKKHNKNGAQSKRTKSKKQDNKGGTNSGTWFGLRFFMSFISACMKCHSFKPSSSTLSV
ncbi:hypothetical protein LIER_43655 [Lithospermum erythrorhizon]|uniref:Uncharacterized protein n=1 Tax=Lithospermum erythrorhizon TaxID=34254 RepID=A0AAV3QK54_LITER